MYKQSTAEPGHRASIRCVRVAWALFALAAAGALAGCGLGAGRTPAGVSLLVTRDFGAQTLRWLPYPKSAGEETVMALLQRNTSISTRSGGGFVESIDGHSGGYEGGQPIDWYYYLNGVQAPKGAAETNVRPGERVWWDLHDWSQAEEVPAVVGSFPEPLLHGLEGRPPRVRLECASPGARPCRVAEQRLSAAGVHYMLARLGVLAPSRSALRVLVGTWSELQGQGAARLLELGPRASGVYARVLVHGSHIALLDAQGRSTATLGAGAGLVAATRLSGSEPEWLVTGTDSAGATLAAQALNENALRERFALALAPTGALGVPEELPLPEPSP